MEKILWKRRWVRRTRRRLMGHEATEDLGGLEAIQCRTEKVLVA